MFAGSLAEHALQLVTRRLSEVDLPGLLDQIDAEGSHWLGLDAGKAEIAVERARGGMAFVGPEPHLAVSAGPGKFQTGGQQAFAEAKATRFRDEQK